MGMCVYRSTPDRVESLALYVYISCLAQHSIVLIHPVQDFRLPFVFIIPLEAGLYVCFFFVFSSWNYILRSQLSN